MRFTSLFPALAAVFFAASASAQTDCNNAGIQVSGTGFSGYAINYVSGSGNSLTIQGRFGPTNVNTYQSGTISVTGLTFSGTWGRSNKPGQLLQITLGTRTVNNVTTNFMTLSGVVDGVGTGNVEISYSGNATFTGNGVFTDVSNMAPANAV